MKTKVKNVSKINGLAFLLTSCIGYTSQEQVEVVPSLPYHDLIYNCTGLKGVAGTYNRISVFRKDNGIIYPIIHYWREKNQIQVNNGTLTQEQAQEVILLCEDELKKHTPYQIDNSDE